MHRDSYAPHDALIAPARRSASLRLLAGGIVATVMAYLLLVYLASVLIGAALPAERWPEIAGDLAEARTPVAVLINLFVFGLLTLAISFSLRLLHGRGLRSLIGPPAAALGQFRRVTIALVLLFAVLAILPMPEGADPLPHLETGRWLAFLPVGLLGVLIQTSAEEFAFRGYLQSQLAARLPSPWIWLGAPSLIFGALHFDPSLPLVNAVVVVLWATLFGLAAGDLTARSGTLGPAIALHLVNNTGALLVAAPEGSFDGLALYTFPFSLATPGALLVWAPVDLMLLLCSWLAARLALRR